MEMEQVPAAAHALSGALGGSFANLLLYPLDVAIVRTQVCSDTALQQGSTTPQLSKKDTQVFATFYSIMKNEGWGALCEGAGDDLVATALQSLLYFFAYEYLRNRKMRTIIRKHGRAPRTLGIKEELFLGAVSGLFCKLFTTPIKNIVIHKQVDHQDTERALAGSKTAAVHRRKSKSAAQCVREIYANKGFTGLWSGYRATLFLSANPSLTYYFYQVLSSRGRETAQRVFLRAAVAKLFATMLTYPVLLAKTRTQARLTRESRIYNILWDTWRTQGIPGLYMGVSGQLLKGFFTQGITMMTKESITQFVVYVYLRYYLVKRSPFIRH